MTKAFSHGDSRRLRQSGKFSFQSPSLVHLSSKTTEFRKVLIRKCLKLLFYLFSVDLWIPNFSFFVLNRSKRGRRQKFANSIYLSNLTSNNEKQREWSCLRHANWQGKYFSHASANPRRVCRSTIDLFSHQCFTISFHRFTPFTLYLWWTVWTLLSVNIFDKQLFLSPWNTRQ